MSVHKEIKRITTHTLQEMKQRGEKISMLTAYDYSMATILDDAGLDVLLVGDLTPQSIYKFGTYTVRAKEEEEANKLKSDVLALQAAGCFGIVLEKIPAVLGKEVSESLLIPTIGIGAGPHCDGQVLVVNDMIGLTKGFKPRFLRQYLNLYEDILGAAQSYIRDVKANDFPNDKEQY
ncbi:MAG: hypothetical protein EOO86_03380 [Pedobacter sp.]|nr:MAG: hypothetical protein EOO86_03380 [Pedobacter sp.]